MAKKLTGTLADEILTPVKGQVRALFCIAGNPAATIPYQARVDKAPDVLDPLVVTFPVMSSSAQLADHVLSPVTPFERFDLSVSTLGIVLFPDSWAQLTQPAIGLPEGSELMEDAHMLREVAARLSRQIIYCVQYPLEMKARRTIDELLALRLQECPLPLD